MTSENRRLFSFMLPTMTQLMILPFIHLEITLLLSLEIVRSKYLFYLMQIWDIRKGCLAYSLFNHSGEVNTCSFSQKGDYFATGGSDCNLLVWQSGFEKPKGEDLSSKGLCESGHRIDKRTVAEIPEHMKKTTKILGSTRI